jgi:hypothetical protein
MSMFAEWPAALEAEALFWSSLPKLAANHDQTNKLACIRQEA